MKARKAPLLALTSALLAATSLSSASAWENPLEHPYLDEPLEICDQGAFFVGGVPKVTKYAAGPTAGEPQQITIGQAYVQFQVPKTRRQWPIVFVHGSSHTGAALDSTPDGKEGWHSYAVRHNLASFVMDQPGRGRSGFDKSVFHEAKATGNWDLVPTFGRITDNGAWTAWFGHIVGGADYRGRQDDPPRRFLAIPIRPEKVPAIPGARQLPAEIPDSTGTRARPIRSLPPAKGAIGPGAQPRQQRLPCP